MGFPVPEPLEGVVNTPFKDFGVFGVCGPRAELADDEADEEGRGMAERTGEDDFAEPGFSGEVLLRMGLV